MKRSKKILVLAASVGLLALVTSFTGARRAVAETVKPVLAQIINTVGVDVLNQPTVNINGIPSVAVVNSHPVTVQGVPTVQIASDDFAPLAVQTPVHAFQTAIIVELPGGTATSANHFSVEGHRLVIEYVGVTTTGDAQARFATTVAGETALFPLPMSPIAGGSQIGSRVAGQPVKVYADPGTQVSCILHSDVAVNAVGGGICSFSGYFVSVP